jgi:formate hydrogenlyase subunit 6/NADH:ubiquinone oxidoreductase subunit I
VNRLLFYRRGGAAGVKVEVSHGRCISCAGCVGVCPVDTITLRELHLVVEQGPCISCGLCIQFCPVGALTPGADYGVAPPTRKPDRVIVV